MTVSDSLVLEATDAVAGDGVDGAWAALAAGNKAERSRPAGSSLATAVSPARWCALLGGNGVVRVTKAIQERVWGRRVFLLVRGANIAHAHTH